MSLYTLTVDLLANTGSFEQGMSRAARITERESRAIQQSLREGVSESVREAGRSFGELSVKVVSAAAAIRLAQAGMGMADEWGQLTSRMKLASASASEAKESMARLQDIAKRSYRDIGETAEVYLRTAKSMREIGFAAESTLDMTEAVALSMVVSATSTQKAKSVTDQFTKSLALGTVRTDELNAVLASAPRLATAMADGLGKTEAELRQMAAAGKLPAEVVLPALTSQLGKLREEADAMPTTVGDAITRLGNSLKQMVGEANEAAGVTQGFARGIEMVADNLPVATAALGSYAAVKVTEATVNRLRAMTAAIGVEREQAVAVLQSSRALEQRAAQQVVDAGMQLRGATTARARLSAEVDLTRAVDAHAAARRQLAAAEAQAAAASAGSMARVGKSLLALAGGWVGLGVMVAATAASWVLFKDKTDDATRSLIDFSGAADVTIEKFRELNKQQQAGQILELNREIGDGYRDLKVKITEMGAVAASVFPENSRLTDEYANRFKDLQQQFEAGKLGADEYSSKVDKVAQEMLNSKNLTERLTSSVTSQVAAVATLSREQERKNGILHSLVDISKSAESQTDATSSALIRQGAAARDAAAGIDQHLKSLQGSIDSQLVNLVRLREGGEKAFMVEVGMKINAAGGVTALTPEQRAEYNRQIELGISLIRQTEAAQNAASASKKQQAAADKATKKSSTELERYRLEASMAAAEIEGPLAGAVEKYRQRMAELNVLVASGSAAEADANVIRAQAAIEYAKVAQEAERAMASPEALLATMDGELAMLGMVGEARERYRRQLMNERDMREELAKVVAAAGSKEAVALAKGAESYEAYEAAMLAAARAKADMSLAMEEAAAAAEDWANVAVHSVEGVADVFADLFSGGIKKSKDFFDDLKDVFKRGWRDIVRTSLQQEFVAPFQKAIQGALSGQGFSAGGFNLGNLFGRGAASGMQSGMSQYMAMAGASAMPASAFGMSPWVASTAGSYGGFGNNAVSMGGMAGQGGGGGFSMGSMGSIPGGSKLMTGSFSSGLPYMSAAMGLGGLYYGATQRGNGGASSVAAGASYGALGVAAGGAIAGGMAGTGMVAGATGAMASLGSAAWIPVVGWILAAAAVVDLVSGGKLFGTKFKPKEMTSNLAIGADGGVATAQVLETRQKSMFGGKQSRWRDIGASEEATEAATAIYEAQRNLAESVARQLGQDANDIVIGAYKATYDKKGKLKSELSTVLGKSYNESLEDFQKRLSSEQIIAAVGKMDSAANAIADDWRKSAETLEAGANFFMNAAVDAKSGLDLWTGIGLNSLTLFVERMQSGQEALTDTYKRLSTAASSYGSLMADISTQLLTGDLSQYQQQALSIERTYRQQIKSANDYAKALGLSGARAEDLAKIEALRATNMGKLQAQIEADKKASIYGLSISDLSPLTDAQKLDETMKALENAVAGGDVSAANAAAQAALGFGRNLYASGNDYTELYNRVTGAIQGMHLGDLDTNDGMSMGALADAIEALPEDFARRVFELAADLQVSGSQTAKEVERSNALLQDQNAILQRVLDAVLSGNKAGAVSALRESLNR